MKYAGHRRIADGLRALGLDDAESDELAAHILSAESSIPLGRDLVIVTGLMGVGKTTELERLHRRAVEAALEDRRAPIPVLIRALDMRGTPLRRAVEEASRELGDPADLGVHLIVDGLDEAGLDVSQLRPLISTLLAEWPGSRAFLGTRTRGDESERGASEVRPLSWESASELITRVYPNFKSWNSGRPEFEELLCRPMYAISHGLDLRQGIAGSVREAELIDSIGRRAVGELGGGAESFGLLVRLGERIVSAGGQPIEMRSLEATPPQLRQLAQSRIVHITNRRITFHLAVLTEWFAALAVLNNPRVLQESTSGPVQAHRWRYALAQALMQASAAQADNIMQTLLARVPATAAWVRSQAEAPSRARISPPAPTAIEAGNRVRRAAKAWLAPWPQLLEQWTVDGELPTLGARMEDTYLVTAWHRQHPPTTDPVVPLPFHVHPLGQRDPDWTGEQSGRPNDGELWPWDWAFRRVRSQVEETITGGTLLADVETCWPELAWEYAHRIVNRSARVNSAPVVRSAIEAKIAEIRRQIPEGDCLVAGGREWRLCEAEAFVADLTGRGIEEVTPPWPAADAQGEWDWLWWSTDQLVRRLNLVTRAALDAYQQMVERHLPAMAPELSTYQLLPARVLGVVIPGDRSAGWAGQPYLRWRLEPLPAGNKNESDWQVVDDDVTYPDRSEWEEWRAMVKSLRGDVAECTVQTWHGGLSDIYSPTPAGAIALDLLNSDLKQFHWSTAIRIVDLDSTGIRPVYR